MYDDLTGDVTAGGNANLLVLGNLGGATQAGGDASVVVGGNETGNVLAGGSLDVAVKGGLEGAMTADAGDADVYALGAITGDVSAGGNAWVATWGTLSDNVTAGQNASAWSDGDMQVNLTATNGDASADSDGVGRVVLGAGGAGEASAFDALTVNMTTGGDADVFSYGSAQVDVQAGGDATLTSGQWLAGSVNAAGSIDALSMGEVSGEYHAGLDASVVAAQDVATATITAGDAASVAAWGGAAGMDVEGTNDAFAFSYGGMGGTVHSSAGTAEVFSAGTAQLTLNAATTATFNGLGDAQLQVTSGADSYVFAAGVLTGGITAGQDAYATSYGLFEIGVTAGRDASVASVGNMSASVQAGRDLWAISYGDLDAEQFTAGHDVVFVGAVGDISGTIHALDVIQRVAAYGSIDDDAYISAGDAPTSTPGSIWLVEAHGPIAGTIAATQDIDLVRSAHAITASITAPSVGTIDPYDPLVMVGIPAMPDTSLADVWAALADDYQAVLAAKAAMAADKAADLAELAADRAAAFDEFVVSMGSREAAVAAINNAVAQLNVSIAQLTASAQQTVKAAQIQQAATWSVITAQAATSKAAFLAALAEAAVEADQEKADLLELVSDNQIEAKIGRQTASDARTKVLADRDNYRDNEREKEFDEDVRQLQFQWAHSWFFVASFVADKIPLVGFIADPLLGLAEAALYGYEGKWDEARLTAIFGFVPLLSGAMFKGAKSLVGVIDDANALRHGAGALGDLGNAAMRGSRNSILDASASIGGNALRHCPLPTSGLCWLAGDAYQWQPLPNEAVGSEAVMAGFSGLLFVSLLVGAGLVGWRVDHRRNRKREEEAMIDALFGDDDGIIDVDDEDLAAALAGHIDSEFNAADEAAFAEFASTTSSFEHFDAVLSGTPQNQARVCRERTPCRSARTVRRSEPRAIRSANGRKPIPSRRSYFGIAWLWMCLLLAAVVGWRYSPAHLSAARKEQLAAAAAAAGPQRYSLLKVEDADVGQRVVSRNPDIAAAGAPTKVDPRTWRLVRLRGESRWDDGTLDVMEVKTLQGPEWLAENRVEVGRLVSIPLDLMEMGLPEDLEAEVTAIEPCPTIQDGPGQVILTTVSRLSDDVYELTLENSAGRRETIHPTGSHRIRRTDGEWAAATDLKAGDAISGSNGELSVISLVRIPGTHRVYNTTVEDQHVYFVGELGALAHNTGCFTKGLYGIAGSGDLHHIATPYGRWGKKFEGIFTSVDRSIDGIGNKVFLPGHYGPHSAAYHAEVLRRLKVALKGVRGMPARAAALEDELESIANDLLSGALKTN